MRWPEQATQWMGGLSAAKDLAGGELASTAQRLAGLSGLANTNPGPVGDAAKDAIAAGRAAMNGQLGEAPACLVVTPFQSGIGQGRGNQRFLSAPNLLQQLAELQQQLEEGRAAAMQAAADKAALTAKLAAADRAKGEPVCWFGGGMDLTPYYPFEEDAVHFHRTCADALAPFGDDKYPRFKAWCDDYFFLKHRNEARGIGGVFFDDFSEGGFDNAFAMTRAVGDAFLSAYLPIVERRQAVHWGERERDHQLYRRGRYVEFNLVWDRGTHFGLQSGGRSESILMSMPPLVRWAYNHQPEPGSPEDRLTSDFLVRRDWI